VYPGFAPESLPAVPGLEGMGVVAKCGPGASKYNEGALLATAALLLLLLLLHCRYCAATC
jgi:D-arabinose 1-dehydrogenase-like Zn-dependent alcohol dehydrogenase